MLNYVMAISISLIVIASSAPFGSAEIDDDLIDISNITVFPQEYGHKIRAGYLNITAYNQAFYYLFC